MADTSSIVDTLSWLSPEDFSSLVGQAEDLRRAEEAARKAEEARKAEQARTAEEARRAEEARKAGFACLSVLRFIDGGSKMPE